MGRFDDSQWLVRRIKLGQVRSSINQRPFEWSPGWLYKLIFWQQRSGWLLINHWITRAGRIRTKQEVEKPPPDHNRIFNTKLSPWIYNPESVLSLGSSNVAGQDLTQPNIQNSPQVVLERRRPSFERVQFFWKENNQLLLLSTHYVSGVKMLVFRGVCKTKYITPSNEYI